MFVKEEKRKKDYTTPYPKQTSPLPPILSSRLSPSQGTGGARLGGRPPTPSRRARRRGRRGPRARAQEAGAARSFTQGEGRTRRRESRAAVGAVAGGGRPYTQSREAGGACTVARGRGRTRHRSRWAAPCVVAAGGRPRTQSGRAIRAQWTRLAKNDSCEDVEAILVFSAWT